MAEHKQNIIERAYLFGELGKAWYKQGDKLFILSANKKAPEECQVSDVESLYDESLEDPIREESNHQEGKFLDVNKVHERLQSLYRAHTALLFALNGLNGKLQEDSRHRVIERANELCQGEQGEQVRKFVMKRLLDRPLPAEADIKGAIHYSRKNKVIRQIYLETEKKWREKEVPRVFLNFLREDSPLAKVIKYYLDTNHVGCLSLEFMEAPKMRADFEKKVNQSDEMIMMALTKTLCFEIIVRWLTTQLKLYRKTTKSSKKPLLICSEDLKIKLSLKLSLNVKDILSQINILSVREVEHFSEQITSLPIIEYLYD